MNTFFKINTQAKIGYKLLSSAELGKGISSNQTHIGLFENTLLFINNAHKTAPAKLIYNNQAKELVCLLDFITNPDGSIRSPKIRAGTSRELIADNSEVNSVVRAIREIVHALTENSNWYLLWFGLENTDLVFYLFNSRSVDFTRLRSYIPNLGNSGTVENTDANFEPLLSYLETLVDNSSISVIKDLEILAQTNENPQNNIRPRFFDIEKARANFQITGKKGEELIAEYFDRQKSQGSINDFNWVNRSRESSFPYDFEVIKNDRTKLFTDVKTTAFDFNQKIILSATEFSFIRQNPNYHIYRVFDLNIDRPALRICNNISRLAAPVMDQTAIFKDALSEFQSAVEAIKISLQPNNPRLHFEGRISL